MTNGEAAPFERGLAETLRHVSRLFTDGGLDSPEADARLLVLAAADVSRAHLILEPDAPLAPAAASRLNAWIARRLAGEPATRIVGRRSFWTLTLDVTPDVLDPRPDSETIVAAALDALGGRCAEALTILDLGVGSGALLLALLSECPNAAGTGVDLSEKACAVARANAARNGLAGRTSIVQGRWTEPLTGRFDLIVSNPPYIERAAIPGLAVEVRAHDPILALDGGQDGLSAYREIIEALPGVLRANGIAVLEVGQGQGAAVTGLARAAGLSLRGSRKDLHGVERALVLSA